MNSQSIEFQDRKVEELVKGFKELTYAAKPNATMILKAPTGSGKTVMLAKMLDTLLTDELSDEFVYIWASMGDLAHQSYLKLHDQYLPDSEYSMMELSSLTADELPANTILFCNWEKMFQIKHTTDDDGNEVEIFNNIFVRIGEDGRNLQEVLEKTRHAGRKVILIVDEAHRTYLGKNSQKLVDTVIRPDLIIEVSATPLLKLPDGYYEQNLGRYIEVSFDEVRRSGLIKNSTIINNDIASVVVNKTSTDIVVLEAALAQREILAQKYKDAGTDIKPLILVQLPSESADKMSASDETTRETVERFMEEHGITYENGKLAIWVSGEHFPEDVKTSSVKNDSEIEVMIFKQAIATGWDCPRASILVMLRDIKSITFEIQTVGRILRMPELKHYEDPVLNSAYVFTNINSIALKEDVDTLAFFKNRFSHRNPALKIDNILWPNVHRERVVGQRNRLNQNFRPIFLPMMNIKFGITPGDNAKTRRQKVDDLLEIRSDELTIPVLSDIEIDNLDNIDAKIFEQHQTLQINADAPFIEHTFNYFLKAESSPYATHDSSRILKQCLYKWFSDNGFDDEAEVQRIVACSLPNQRLISGIIKDAKAEFNLTMGKETELRLSAFTLPMGQEFGEKYEAYLMSKHILQPFYRPSSETSKIAFATERAFERALNDSQKVVWWYRNGTNEPKYFGIPYQHEDENGIITDKIFYPDYIVKFTDNTYGIFDTKAGDTTNPDSQRGEDVNEKADGLQAFLKDYMGVTEAFHEQKIDVDYYSGLWGGIVNVDVDKNRFYLQGDAVTAEMAKKASFGDWSDINAIRDTHYDKNNWISFDI